MYSFSRCLSVCVLCVCVSVCMWLLKTSKSYYTQACFIFFFFFNVCRDHLPATMDSKGSFLDDMSRLSTQSVSAMDLTNQLKLLNFSTSSDNSPQDRKVAGDSGPDLIQFSGATEVGNADQETKYVWNLTTSITCVVRCVQLLLRNQNVKSHCEGCVIKFMQFTFKQ